MRKQNVCASHLTKCSVKLTGTCTVETCLPEVPHTQFTSAGQNDNIPGTGPYLGDFSGKAFKHSQTNFFHTWH